MTRSRHVLFVLTACLWLGCTGIHPAPDADVMDVTLPAPANDVKQALIEILLSRGYDVEEEGADTVRTDVREQINGPWDWLLRWRFGVGKSRVEAKVLPLEADRTRVRLQVFHESKDGIFDHWEDAEPPVPRSAANHIRLLKNSLQIL